MHLRSRAIGCRRWRSYSSRCSQGVLHHLRAPRTAPTLRRRRPDRPQQPAPDAGRGRDRGHAAGHDTCAVQAAGRVVFRISGRRDSGQRDAGHRSDRVPGAQVRVAQHPRDRCFRGGCRAIRPSAAREDGERRSDRSHRRTARCVAGMSLPANVVGKPVDLDPTATIKLALQLHPGVSRVVVVLGATERDRAWERRIREAAARIVEAPDFEYIAGLPTADILRRLEALTAGTVVYTPGYFTDGAGETVTPRRSVERIAQASAVPVYGALDTFLDSGIVGGSMTPYEQQAREAAAIVVRLLDGATLASLDLSPVPQVAMVDWRQLRRWRVDEGSLPAGTIVRFREPSVWDRYWREISIGIAIVLLQAGLIAALLVQRRARDRMATALEESQNRMNLAARAARLSTLDMGSCSRQDPGDTTSTATHRRAVDLVRGRAHKHAPCGSRRAQRAVSKAFATGEEIDVEYRTVAADGEVRWIAARGRAEKEDGQLIGVAIDVTERKRAELRAVEDRNALRHMTRVSMLGQLSASIAHQLNQPLAAILGNAEAARKMLGARERRSRRAARDLQRHRDRGQSGGGGHPPARRAVQARRDEDGAARPQRADPRNARPVARRVVDPPRHARSPSWRRRCRWSTASRCSCSRSCSISCSTPPMR